MATQGRFLSGKINPPQPATALMMDVRDFTSSLLSEKREEFLQQLTSCYSICDEAARVACGGSSPPREYFINSTGDGVVIVFLSPKRHFLDGYLAALLMYHRLRTVWQEKSEKAAFGIGVESGMVQRIEAGDGGRLVTFLGDCINTAARVEAATKDHGRTHVIIGEDLNNLLCKRLYKMDHKELAKAASSAKTKRRHLLAIRAITKLNENLLLKFLHQHTLKGLKKPIHLFRFSTSLVRFSSHAVEDLYRQLTVDKAHLAEIFGFLKR